MPKLITLCVSADDVLSLQFEAVMDRFSSLFLVFEWIQLSECQILQVKKVEVRISLTCGVTEIVSCIGGPLLTVAMFGPPDSRGARDPLFCRLMA